MRLLPLSWVATPARRLGARLLFYAAVLFLGLPLALSQVMIGALRQPAGPVIAGFREVRLRSGGVGLRAWEAPGAPARTAVVLVHGVGDSLESYQDQATVLRARGHAVLLLDLRGHGGSATAPITLGGHEREDVRAAMAHLRQAGLAPAGFVLMGWSMGAVAVLRAAVLEPDVRAVVAEAPFDTYRNTVARHAWLLYRIPRWLPLIPLSIAVAERRAGFDADEIDAVAAARALRAPLLLIADGADQRMPEPVVRRVFEAHRGTKTLWVAPGAPHVGAVLDSSYWPRVLGFLADSGC